MSSARDEARSFFEGTTERPLDYTEALAWDLLEQVEAPPLGNVIALAVGTRVRLKHDVERYPHFIADRGLEGVVVYWDSDVAAVRMDVHIGGAETWDNEIVWSLRDGEEPMEDLELVP